MRTATLLTVLLLVITSTLTFAGKNREGALIVHVMDIASISSNCLFSYDVCEDTEECFPDPESCEAADTEGIPDPFQGHFVWFYAAFPEQTDPGVTVIYFGVDHNFQAGFLSAWRFCGPPGSLEIPDQGWPDDTDAGNSVAFGEPVVGDHLIRFYLFGVYGDAGNYIGSAVNPTGGYAAFVSDDNPGVLDEVHRFGQVRWGEPGFNECPEPLVEGACCFADGSCEFLTETLCDEAGGHSWLGEGSACEPNPCEPVAVEESTLGKIKSAFR